MAVPGSQLGGGIVKGKFFLAWVVAFVVVMAGGFVVHGTLLHADYQQLVSTGLFRSETDAQAYFPWMILAHVILAGAFVWIYSRGIEARPWLGQGVRYGVAVACLTAVPMYLIYYAVQPMPGSLTMRQIVYDFILWVIAGIVTAWVYRGQTARA
jgi:hypothetical protein